MLADKIRAMTAPHWLGLFGLVLLSWVLLAAMAVPADAFCTTTPDAAGYMRLVAMWVLMSGAMMAPTALPAFATYDDLSRQTEARIDLLFAGYMTVWIGFSVIAAALQMALFQAELVSAFGDSRSVWLSAVLLVAAGLYQFSALADAAGLCGRYDKPCFYGARYARNDT